MKILFTIIFSISVFMQPAFSSERFDELMKDEAFRHATPEDRLTWLNTQIARKKINQSSIRGIIEELYLPVLDTSNDPVGSLVKYTALKKRHKKLPSLSTKFISNLYWTAIKGETDATARLLKYAEIKYNHKKIPSLSNAFLSRLYWEALQTEPTAIAKLQKYGKLKAEHKKLSSLSDVGRTLVTHYLATDPAAMKMDIKGKIKLVNQLESDRLVSWTTTASIYTGMLTHHLSTYEPYLAADAVGKLKYLKQLVSIDGVVRSLSSTAFAKGVAVSYIASLPAESRVAAIKEITPILDTFTKSAIRDAFPQ